MKSTHHTMLTALFCAVAFLSFIDCFAQIEKSRLIVIPQDSSVQVLQEGDSVLLSTSFKLVNFLNVDHIDVGLDSAGVSGTSSFSQTFYLNQQQTLPSGVSFRRLGNNFLIQMGDRQYHSSWCVQIKTYDNSSTLLDSLNTCL